MLFQSKKKNANTTPVEDSNACMVDAIRHHCPIICFSPEGVIEDANTLFLDAIGYSLAEIKGKHHRILCSNEEAQSKDYGVFWSELASGKSHKGTFLRRKKDGSDLWIEATYFPVLEKGRVTRVFKIANDITESHELSLDQEALLHAIDRSSAVIEFMPDGTVLNCNMNFVKSLGYKNANELKGKHHRQFCFDEFYQQNPNFWQDLAHGKVKSGLFKRQNKNGSIVWIEATYNPVFDSNNKVKKIVKVATDVTERINKQLAVQKAAEIAHSTSVETAQVSERGAYVLGESVKNSEQIVDDIQKTSHLVEDLNKQSEEIAKIVETIGSIADQTNLLALNAAIEAARAGEHGRGFAVVADEVRTLASRTRQSTGEINDMVNRNTELVERARESMVGVTDQAVSNSRRVQEASGIIDEILKGAVHVSSVVGELVDTSDS